MSFVLDFGAVERASADRQLRLSRAPQRGQVGEVRSASVGSSMELHDFRHYHPGDDLRHLDWNAVARTGELVLRVRQDEVSPRVEVVLDASKSMALTPAKASRALELCWLVLTLARRTGLQASLVIAGDEPQKALGEGARVTLERCQFAGAEPFDVALRRAPALLPCGARVIVSDLLFESAPEPLTQRLASGAHTLHLLQLLDDEDASPSEGAGAQLVDSETGESLERFLNEQVLSVYRERFAAHQRHWVAAARRVRASMVTLTASHTIEAIAARELHALVETGR